MSFWNIAMARSRKKCCEDNPGSIKHRPMESNCFQCIHMTFTQCSFFFPFPHKFAPWIEDMIRWYVAVAVRDLERTKLPQLLEEINSHVLMVFYLLVIFNTSRIEIEFKSNFLQFLQHRVCQLAAWFLSFHLALVRNTNI